MELIECAIMSNSQSDCFKALNQELLQAEMHTAWQHRTHKHSVKKVFTVFFMGKCPNNLVRNEKKTSFLGFEHVEGVSRNV